MRRDFSTLLGIGVATLFLWTSGRSSHAPPPARPAAAPTPTMTPERDASVDFEAAGRTGMRFKTGISLAGLILTLNRGNFELVLYSTTSQSAPPPTRGTWRVDRDRLILNAGSRTMPLAISHTRPYRLTASVHDLGLPDDAYVQMPLIEELVYSTPTGTPEDEAAAP